MKDFYERDNSNIHRGLYASSERATARYEDARTRLARFINARSSREIVFTKNTTEAINLVAQSWGEEHICAGDEIALTVVEHHSNFVPWVLLARRKKATLVVIPLFEGRELRMQDFARYLSKKTKLLVVHHVSNVLGSIAPLTLLAPLIARFKITVLIDAAQSIAHLPVDVRQIPCDFLAFSGHKMYGPTGIGVLYGREALLAAMPPWMTGGGMIQEVNEKEVHFADLPRKFEAGTPPLAEAIGLHAAADFISSLGFSLIRKHEEDLLAYGRATLSSLPGLRFFGPDEPHMRASVLSFTMGKLHSHDIASLANEKGVALRAGFHCAQPLMRALKVSSVCRASFAIYNTREDIDRLYNALVYARKILKRV